MSTAKTEPPPAPDDVEYGDKMLALAAEVAHEIIRERRSSKSWQGRGTITIEPQEASMFAALIYYMAPVLWQKRNLAAALERPPARRAFVEMCAMMLLFNDELKKVEAA